MSLKTFRDIVKQVWHLNRAKFYWERANFAQARRRLERALAMGEQSELFTMSLAADGLLKGLEASSACLDGEELDLGAAQARFLESLNRIDPDGTPDDKYVAAFCRFQLAFLAAGCDENVGSDEVEAAHSALMEAHVGASSFARRILAVGSIETIRKIFADREPKGPPQGVSRTISETNAKVVFDF